MRSLIPMMTVVTGVGFSAEFCLSVFFHTISQNRSKLDIEIIHNEPWQLIYFGVKMLKGQRHEAQKAVPACFLQCCECQLLLIVMCIVRVVSDFVFDGILFTANIYIYEFACCCCRPLMSIHTTQPPCKVIFHSWASYYIFCCRMW